MTGQLLLKLSVSIYLLHNFFKEKNKDYHSGLLSEFSWPDVDLSAICSFPLLLFVL